MRIVFFGSGAFGLPTLKALVHEHEVALVVTQPDREAGRNRKLTATPISQFAAASRIAIVQPENVNDAVHLSAIQSVRADAFVVIAFGQKLGRELRSDVFAINLHASLLPKYRGAAPINRAIMDGESITGLSVILLADRMDAGDILGQTITPIDPMETAAELHDRLAQLGPELVLSVLSRQQSGRLSRQPQDDSLATRAPKLSKSEGTVRFDQPAARVRSRVHGLTPWPGCRVNLEGSPIRLHRVDVVDETPQAPPGTIVRGELVACSPGFVRLLAVQPAGGKLMSFAAYRAGHPLKEGARMTPMDEPS